MVSSSIVCPADCGESDLERLREGDLRLGLGTGSVFTSTVV